MHGSQKRQAVHVDPYAKRDKEAIQAEVTQVLQGKPRQSGNLRKMSNKEYEPAMADLQIELVKPQEWIKKKGLRVVVIFGLTL